MKKLILILMVMFLAFPAWSADEWLKTRPASTDNWTDWPAANVANNAALDRVLANYREGMAISYSSATTISVAAGEVVCSNAAGTIRKMRQNTAATNVTFTDIDTGAEEASKTYYVYANCDADATTATFKVSLSATTPTGVTSYKRLGSFANDSSSNITIGSTSNDSNIFNASIGARSSKTGGTTYQALTDGFVTAWSDGGNGDQIVLYSDSASTPTTAIDSERSGLGVNGEYINVHGAIKKGDYYKVTNVAGTITMYFTPLGN